MANSNELRVTNATDAKAIYKQLQISHFTMWYGQDIASVFDDTHAVVDLIQPGDSITIGTATGYEMSKDKFQDHAFMQGYSLATPWTIARGDRLRYAVKKGKKVRFIAGGSVKWVDGMLAPDGQGWEDRCSIPSPQYITLCNARDKSKSWSLQLTGQKVFLWRLPFISQKDRQAAAEGLEIVHSLESQGASATNMMEHMEWFLSLPSKELYRLARDREKEELAKRNQARNNVKVIN